MEKTAKKPYVIVRAESVGIFAGILEEVDHAHRVVILSDCRRLWYWIGAASLSGLAVYGTAKPDACKVPVAVPRVTLSNYMEIDETTAVGEASIRAIPEWKI